MQKRDHRGIGGMKFDMVGFAKIGLDRRLAINQCHDDLAVLRSRLFADHDEIARKDPFIDHRFALYAQSEGLSCAQHGSRHFDELGLCNRLDGIAGGDNADQRNLRGSGKLCDGDLNGAADPPHPAFVAGDGNAGGVKGLG